MLEISDLGLSLFQLNEVEDAEPALVTAWLSEASQPHVSSPRALFLWGLRSGEQPGVEREVDRAHEVLRAERWIERVGILYDRESDVLDELFGERGALRQHDGDVQLQTRLVELWKRERPRGEQVEREQVERAQRNAATYTMLKEADHEPGSDQRRA